MSVIP